MLSLSAAATSLPRQTTNRLLSYALCVGLITSPLISLADDPGTVAAPLPPIRSAAEINYPPYSMVNAEGAPYGFSVELLRAALAVMGRDVTFRTGIWADVRGWLDTGEVDALPLVGRTPEREALFDFTVPYMTIHGALIVRKDSPPVYSLNDLTGKQVAVMRGDNAEEYLRRSQGQVIIHTTATFEIALRELATGQHDAVLVQRLVGLRLIQQAGFDNLKVVPQPVAGFRQDFCFAVRKGNSALLALLNEGLSLVVADGTHRRLHAKWFAALELPGRRLVVGGDHNFPPYEFLDAQGRPAGYNIDLSRAIARALGLNIEIRLGPWPDILLALENGDIDAIQGMYYSPGRDLLHDFTQPHLAAHYVAVTRRGAGQPPAKLAELEGLEVVLQDQDFAHVYLTEHAPHVPVHLAASHFEVLRQLAAGNFDCAIVARTSAIHLIKTHGWDNLAIASRPLFVGQYCYAVTEGNTAVLTQLSEGLLALQSSGELREIYRKWFSVYEESPPLVVAAFEHWGWIIGLLLSVLGVIFLWSFLLRRQVAARTAELRANEAFTRLILDNLPVGIAVNSISPAVALVYMNKLFAELYRTDPDALRDADSFWEAVYEDPALRLKMKTQILADCASGDPDRMHWEDVPIIRKGEETSYISARNIPLPDGKLVISTVWDVTERKRHLDAIQSNELLRRVAGRTARLGGWRVDLPHRTVTWSDEAAMIHGNPPGYSPTIEEGLAYFTPDWQPKLAALLEDCATAGTPFDEEMELVNAAGERLWVRIIGEASRDANGAITAVEGAVQDITADVTLRTQLQQAQKLESIGRLAGGVAHDFNNMLSVIGGYTDLALRRIDPNDRLATDLRQVRAAADRSVAIVRQLLAFARKQAITPQIIDLNQTVASMLKMLRHLIGENIEVVWQPGADLHPVLMDPSQVDQILANLCVNARDAIADVGQVTITTQNRTFDQAYCEANEDFEEGSYVMLAVSDTGSGMSKEVLAQIFEPFFTTKGPGVGTGLGLPTVYGIVRQNNGFVHVYSELGKGTTFRIYLRADHSEDAAAEPAPTPTLLRGHGEQILLVEDERSILDMTHRMLEDLGYRVLLAPTPADAIKLFETHAAQIDLLLTDVIMPLMNGRDLTATLVAIKPQLRCLYMSGFTADVIAHHGVLQSDVHFIQKPFTLHDLAAKLRAVLS
jgi:ABC-type amino acid transport substrate-binding protein/signal transduction histidine kinase